MFLGLLLLLGFVFLLWLVLVFGSVLVSSPRGCYIFGTGVCSRASCIICCGVISSVSASVVSDILCGITRGASFFMSSGIMKFLWFSRA